jgi:ribosomal-protein-alanine N-acetyltransferase
METGSSPSVSFVAPSHQVNPSPEVVIERARVRDVRAVAAIQRQSFAPRLAYGPTALLTLLWWPNVAFLVARDPESGRVIGCGIADRNRGTARVMNLAVAPDLRRGGVGRRLLRALEEKLPEGDVTLMVQEHNAGAQALYLSEGFRRSGFSRDYYGTGQHGIVMRKTRSTSATGGGTISVP